MAFKKKALAGGEERLILTREEAYSLATALIARLSGFDMDTFWRRGTPVIKYGTGRNTPKGHLAIQIAESKEEEVAAAFHGDD